MRRPKRPTFKSEAELCASWAASVTAEGWALYPETSGWDFLAVKDGCQVGVQAKLHANLDVLAQAIRDDFVARGPHHAVVLVPWASRAFHDVAAACRILVIFPRWRTPLDRNGDDLPAFPEWGKLGDHLMHAAPLHFDEPEWLPPDIPDLPAGVPCPVQLTAWKYQALRLLARLEILGYVTGKDFAEIGLNRSRWYHHWLIPVPETRPQRWIKKPGRRLADDQHPDVFATVVEATREAMRMEAGQVVTPGAQDRLPLFGFHGGED